MGCLSLAGLPPPGRTYECIRRRGGPPSSSGARAALGGVGGSSDAHELLDLLCLASGQLGHGQELRQLLLADCGARPGARAAAECGLPPPGAGHFRRGHSHALLCQLPQHLHRAAAPAPRQSSATVTCNHQQLDCSTAPDNNNQEHKFRAAPTQAVVVIFKSDNNHYCRIRPRSPCGQSWVCGTPWHSHRIAAGGELTWPSLPPVLHCPSCPAVLPSCTALSRLPPFGYLPRASGSWCWQAARRPARAVWST